MNKKGFTLSEVLITLGVIGVVAAMTLPSVINKFRAKVLETGFKKSYSNLNKAFLNTKYELQTESIYRDFATYKSNGGYTEFHIFQNAFYKNLKAVKVYTGDYPRKTYNGGQMGTTPGWCPKPVYILPDGSSVETVINSAIIWLSFDTNGPVKGPNRYGFDIFTFGISGRNDKITPYKHTGNYYCSAKSDKPTNGVACAYYAINNINYDDRTKTYWDNLPR